MEYEVVITETLERVICVKASSAEEAYDKVRDRWTDEDIVLDADDFIDVDFRVEPAENNDEKRNDGFINVLLVEPNKQPRMACIKEGLDSLQNTVGGYIEAIYPFTDNVALVCNEEGKMNHLELNRPLTTEQGVIYDVIAGTFFICGLGEEDFTSLPENLIDKYIEMFRLR